MRELIDRMGHDSQRAAMIYLHGSARQQTIADSLSRYDPATPDLIISIPK